MLNKEKGLAGLPGHKAPSPSGQMLISGLYMRKQAVVSTVATVYPTKLKKKLSNSFLFEFNYPGIADLSGIVVLGYEHWSTNRILELQV